MLRFSQFILCLILAVCIIKSQLVVNVKNNGGDVYRETIEANTTQDIIVLEFRKTDGTLVTQFIDGRNEVNIFKVVILPEEERGQTQIQTMCFVSRFTKNEFISSDAMSKLRQKNPSAVRHPEESRSEELFEMDVRLNVEASHVVSAHIAHVCGDAPDLTYMRDNDLKLISQILGRDYSILETIVHRLPLTDVTSCPEVNDLARPCVCHYTICVGWYPCGLKYCRGKDSAGRVVSYRCGIKTCSKCRRFAFHVARKQLCIWDETEFRLPPSWDSGAQEAGVESYVDESPDQRLLDPSAVDLKPQVDGNLNGIEQPLVNGEAGGVIKMEQRAVIEIDGKPVKPIESQADGKDGNIPDDDEDGE